MRKIEVVYRSEQYFSLNSNWVTWELKRDYWGRKIAVMVWSKL